MLVVGAKHEDSRRENEKKPVGCMPLFTFGVEVSHPTGVKTDYDSEANEVNRSLYLLKKNKKNCLCVGNFKVLLGLRNGCKPAATVLTGRWCE